MILSSKAMLAYLWGKHPGHPNLLPATLAYSNSGTRTQGMKNVDWAKEKKGWAKLNDVDWTGKELIAKPLFGREGIGLLYSDDFLPDGQTSATHGVPEAFFQAVADAPEGETLEQPSSDDLQLAALSNGHLPDPDNIPGLVNVVKDQLVSTLLDRPFGGAEETAGKTAKQHSDIFLGKSVVQEFHPVACLQGRHVISSAWVVRGMPVAACFREDRALTTNDDSCFVPHFVEPDKDWLESKSCCPPKTFAIGPKQEAIRRELYGEGKTESTYETSNGYGAQLANLHPSLYKEEPRNHHHTGSCYVSGGYGGRGYSHVGGGGVPPRNSAKAKEKERQAKSRLSKVKAIGPSGRFITSPASKKASRKAARASHPTGSTGNSTILSRPAHGSSGGGRYSSGSGRGGGYGG